MRYRVSCREGGGGGGGGFSPPPPPPTLDLRTQTLHMDNQLLCSLSRQPPNHISVLPPLPPFMQEPTSPACSLFVFVVHCCMAIYYIRVKFIDISELAD